MNSPKKDKRLQAVATNWSNNSHSSINTTSDAATFHSANDIQHLNHSQNMELHSLKTQFPFTEQHILPTPHITKSSRKDSIPEVPSLVNSVSSSRRTSTSTSTSRRTSPSKSKRRTYQGTTNTYITRPVTKRATRSSPQTLSSFQCHRPHLNARHTIPYLPSTPPQTANQFFHFPSLPTPDASPNSKDIPQPQPPATMQYWTSDNTRRLEYAAIDAASRGLRGFLNRLIPECMLPKDMRRTRFCEGDEDSDAGSVRRYRLDLPGEEEGKNTEKEGKRSGVFRRWSGGLRSSTA